MRILLFLVPWALFPTLAGAYVSGSVPVPAGGSDIELGVAFERGLLGPQNLPESQQTQSASITHYRLRVGHNFGNWLGLEDFTARLSGDYFKSIEESLGGTVRYPEDKGTLFGLELSGNILHEVTRIVGVFARFTVPAGVLVEKFEKPRIDTFGLGLQAGFEISDLVGNETLLYYGAGLVRGGQRHQNASLILSNLASLRWRNVVAKSLALKLGPFFESDVTERNDAQYGLVGFRGFRVGFTTVGVLQLSDSAGIELGYVQKLSGAYFTATKDFFVTTRLAL